MTENQSIRRHFWIEAFRLASKCVCADGSPVCFSEMAGVADIALKEFDARFEELDKDDYMKMQDFDKLDGYNQ